MGTRTRIVALVRTPAPVPVAERQEVALARLRSLFDAGSIDTLEITACPWRIRAADALTGEILGIVEEIESWADVTRRRVDPCFDRHPIQSSFSGEEGEVITLPVLCIARYEDDALVDVYPVRDEAANYTVEEYLAVLESDLSA